MLSSGIFQSTDVRWTLVAAAAALVCLPWVLRNRKPPLPPGPRGLPLVGNIFDAPIGEIWLQFAKLGDVWGDICSLTVFGQTLVIVNTFQIAEDLLEGRGTNFSDRPVIPMGGELVGLKSTLSLCQYGEHVRTVRKLFHQRFGTHAAIESLVPLISSEIHALLQNIARDPGRVFDEIGRMTGGLSLRIAYGYHLVDGPAQDPLLREFETAADNFASTTTPGAYLVDIIPSLKYWPEWLPGGGFHATAKIMRKQLVDTFDFALEYVREQMAMGTAEKSFTSNLLEEQRYDDHFIKWAAATIQAGGSDTAAAQLNAFFLAMSIYPEVQAAAQKELDSVVGKDRLPELSDRSELPYVNALCKEVLRWHIAAPTAVPHRTREDFVYTRDGKPMLIPKDSMVIPNLWKMTHDPERYSDPMVFDPTRFIATESKSAEPDPTKICFGFGRRICPGRLLAETTLFLACSALLASFDISKARENGVVVEPRLGQTTGTVSHPFSFKCSVLPRSAKALELIRAGPGL
ncbi:cytochrome P450 [Mycena belliarum]|uniref:Cytochrome P450 n=1 Tax=Mycena belliarum TaxID=1033014 RepID=A0AAD6XP53_9AGAR|nr:cytochrome P450 [Mycena belliae]